MSNNKKNTPYFTSQDKSLIAPPLSNDQAAVEEIVKAYRQHIGKTSDDVAFDSMQKATPELNIMESEDNMPHSIHGDKMVIRMEKSGHGIHGSNRGKDKDGKKRLHAGLDILTLGKDKSINAAFSGTVTKTGYFYDDNKTQYVDVYDGNYTVRYAYVTPGVEKGDVIKAGDEIGLKMRPWSWDHNKKTGKREDKGISDHVHVEVVPGDIWDRDKRIDPNEIFRIGK